MKPLRLQHFVLALRNRGSPDWLESRQVVGHGIPIEVQVHKELYDNTKLNSIFKTGDDQLRKDT